MNKRILISISLMLLLLVSFGLSSDGENEYLKLKEFDYKETRTLVKLVREAAELINKYDKDEAFDYIKKNNSKWRKNEIALFVDKMDGTELLNLANPELQGKNIIDMQDANGKLITYEYVCELYKYAANKKESWIHCVLPNPANDDTLDWKTIYVTRIKNQDGTEYIVGAGLFNMRMEQIFVINMVEDACELVQKKGKKAFKKLSAKDKKFFYKDTYIFITAEDGTELLNPAFPDIENTNLWNFQDTEGKYFVQEYINLAKEEIYGWVDYYWPKPEETIPSHKYTYVKGIKIDDELWIVGSGLYLD